MNHRILFKCIFPIQNIDDLPNTWISEKEVNSTLAIQIDYQDGISYYFIIMVWLELLIVTWACWNKLRNTYIELLILPLFFHYPCIKPLEILELKKTTYATGIQHTFILFLFFIFYSFIFCCCCCCCCFCCCCLLC